MESALIVSNTEKGIAFFKEMLNAASVKNTMTVKSCAEARRLLLERTFELVIINSPLLDETGESLAVFIASSGGCQVILAVKNEYCDEVSSATEDYGVLTIGKPISRNLFWSALKLVKSAQARLRLMRAENDRLVRKIEDIRIVDRAKCLLISYLGMSENEAHKYIEKQAMDMRITKRAVAEGILKTYES